MKQTILILLSFLTAFPALAQSTPTVDLLWSAQTYRPSFYTGHSLATPRSQVRVVALVTGIGNNTDPNQLEYRWQRDGQVLPTLSGVGKHILTFTAGQVGESHQVQVTIANLGGSGAITKSVSIPVVTPALSIYEDEPLTGINYGRAIGASLVLTQPEINLAAEPYFFNTSDVQIGKLDYRWTLNDQRVVPSPADNRLITFAAPSGTSGENTIRLTIDNLNNLFQAARREFQILFGAASGFNF